MTRVKIPMNEYDMPEDAVFLARKLIQAINLSVIVHDTSDENIELATEWVAQQYEDQAR